MRSLDVKDVNFHSITLSLCATSGENLRRGMPESFVRVELESLNIRVQGFTQMRSGRYDQDCAKGRLPNPSSLCQWREDLRGQKCDCSLTSVACESRWRCTCIVKARCNASTARNSATRNVTEDTYPGASLVWDPNSPVGAFPAGVAPVLWLWDKPHSQVECLCEVEGKEGSSCKARVRTQKNERHTRPTCLS